MLMGRDADGAGRLLAKLAQRVEFRLDLLDAVPDGLKESFAGGSGRDAPGRASQQPQAKPRLEPPKGVTQS